MKPAAPPPAAPPPAETLPCPYCTERISAQAVVCRHCHRDLQFFAPLHRELRAQAKRIEALEAQNARLLGLLTRHWPGLQAGLPPGGTGAAGLPLAVGHAPGDAPPGADAADAAGATAADHPAPAPARALPRLRGLRLLARVALPVLALLLAHALIVLALDANVLWLRAVSIVLPLALGLGFALRWRAPLATHAACALAVAVLAVAGMTAVIAHVDELPFWPQDPREWQEALYYMASIAFGDLTGVLLARLAQHRRQRSQDQLTQQLAELMLAGQPATPGRLQQVRKQAEAVRDLMALITPIVTAVVSIATGIGALLK
ncbi:MAG: hypothetical protein Q4F13_12130 [Pseudomonadota bacterium]|nr:hypothetical protein [Pseudomonadota bacterium]